MDNNNIGSRIFWFIFYVLLQGLLLSHINFLGSINPYIYVLFLLRMPCNVGRISLMLVGFFLGLMVDIMSSTPGIHASATTLLAYLKPNIDNLYVDKDDKKNGVVVNSRLLGLPRFLQYAAILVFAHHFMYFLVSAFDMSLILTVSKNTLCSFIFTMTIILAIEYFNSGNRRR